MSANGIDKEHTEIIALSLALSIVCSAKKENMWMRKGFSKTMIARLACAKQYGQHLGQRVEHFVLSD